MVDSTQALLMLMDIDPVSPSQLYETAKTILVENEHTRKPKKP
jgi:hypothetical protein